MTARPAVEARVWVVPPRAIFDDATRLARLDAFLRAEFPDVAIVMAESNDLPGNQSAVGLMAEANARAGLDDAAADRLTDEVSAATETFVSQKRLH